MPTENVAPDPSHRPISVAEIEEGCYPPTEGGDSRLTSDSEDEEWEDAGPAPAEVPPPESTEEAGSVVYEPEPNQEDVVPARPIKHVLKEMMELFDEMKDVEEARNPFNEHAYMKCCGWIRELYQFAREDSGCQLADNNDVLVDYVVQLKRDEGRTKKAMRLLLKDNTILMGHCKQLRGALDELSQLAPAHRRREILQATADATDETAQALDENHNFTLSAPPSRSTEDRDFLRAYTATLLQSSDEALPRGGAVDPLYDQNATILVHGEPAPGTEGVPANDAVDAAVHRRWQRSLEDTALLHEVSARWGVEATPPVVEGAPMED